MNNFSFFFFFFIISNSTKINADIPYLRNFEKSPKVFAHRINLIKTLKTYIRKYCQYDPNKYNILYLSILYLDIILSKNKISLSYERNLKYLCLCCFLMSLKFIGDYDISKKIIKNFCHNYKDEYKIFEAQCLILLEHNLIYSTAYDYITMILMKEQKNLLSICSSLLYQICEDNLYICYSPFYISIAIIQLAKTTINDRSHNHYDKYFHDQRVKYLYKTFIYLINPSPDRYTQILDKKTINYSDTNDDYFSYMNIYDNNNNYLNNTKKNKPSNINIFTNNNIQNNIVIINDQSLKTNENNDYNDYARKACITTKNKTPIKIFVNRYNISMKDFGHLNNNKTNENGYNNDNAKSNTNYYMKKKINTNAKNSTLSKSFLNSNISVNNYNSKTYKISKIKQNKDRKTNYKICIYPKSSNNLVNYYSNKNTIIQTPFEIKKNQLFYESKENNLSNDELKQNKTEDNKSLKKKLIYTNKSSLNFKLVSGVSKDKLVKLSKNLSKSLVKSLNKNISNKKTINN